MAPRFSGTQNNILSAGALGTCCAHSVSLASSVSCPWVQYLSRAESWQGRVERFCVSLRPSPLFPSFLLSFSFSFPFLSLFLSFHSFLLFLFLFLFFSFCCCLFTSYILFSNGAPGGIKSILCIQFNVFPFLGPITSMGLA